MRYPPKWAIYNEELDEYAAMDKWGELYWVPNCKHSKSFLSHYQAKQVIQMCGLAHCRPYRVFYASEKKYTSE